MFRTDFPFLAVEHYRIGGWGGGCLVNKIIFQDSLMLSPISGPFVQNLCCVEGKGTYGLSWNLALIPLLSCFTWSSLESNMISKNSWTWIQNIWILRFFSWESMLKTVKNKTSLMSKSKQRNIIYNEENKKKLKSSTMRERESKQW